MSKPDGLEFNTPDTIEELSQKEISRELDKNDEEPKEELYTEEDEKRMDVIGQNGNDGIHYDREDNYKNLITTTKNLTEEEVENLSKEIAKTENKIEENPINPTKKELEKLAEALNINYSDENVDLDRLTDTTQTLINKVVNSKDEENKNTLKYEGRK